MFARIRDRQRDLGVVGKAMTRRRLHESGLSFRETNRAMSYWDEELMAMAAMQAQVEVPDFNNSALGDGTIIQAIIAFFNSENGKKLIDALVALLLSFIS